MSKPSSASRSLPQSGFFNEESSENAEIPQELNFVTQNAFPIIAEVNRSISAPPFLLFLQYGILFMQLLFGSFFLFHNFTNFPYDFRIFTQILFFGMVGNSDKLASIFLSLILIDFVTFLFIVIVFIDYRSNHEYRIWQLYVLRIWHGLLFTYFLIPNILFVIISISYVGSTNTSASILLFLMSVVCLFYSYYHVKYFTELLNQSPFLFSGISFNWRPSKFIPLILLYAVPFSIDIIFRKASKWLHFIPPVFVIIVSPIFFIHMINSPFTYVFLNACWASLAIGMIFGSIFSILRYIDSINLPMYIILCSPIVALIIAIIILYPILKRRRDKIKSQLFYATAFPHLKDGPDSQDDCIHYLKTLDIRSKRKAYLYLQVGIEEGADLFLDGSLPTLILNRYSDDPEIIIFITWLISFFPPETMGMFKNLIFMASKFQHLSLVNRAMFYQLHRLFLFRTSVSSKEAHYDLIKIERITDRCISSFCRVWTHLSRNNDITPRIYHQLARLQHSAEASWAEILDKYPNDPRFAALYSKYLLEGKCQFRDAIRYHQKTEALELGHKMQADRMFHRFVQMFPFYLKKEIIDTQGRILKKLSNQEQQNPRELSSLGDGTEIEDSANIDDIKAEQFLPRFQLRLAYGKVIKKMQAKITLQILFSSVFSLLLLIIYSIIISLYLHNLFNERESQFKYWHSINDITGIHEVLMPLVTWVWAEQVYTPFNETEKNSILGPLLTSRDNFLNTQVSHDQNIYNLSLMGLMYIDNFSQLLYQSQSNTDMYQDLVELTSDPMIIIGTCNADDNVVYINNQTSPIDFLWRSFFFKSSMLSIDSSDVREHWETSNTLCETYIKGFILSGIAKLMAMNASKTFAYEYELLRKCNVSHFLMDDNKELQANLTISPESCNIQRSPLGRPVNEPKVKYGESDLTNNSISDFFITFTPFFVLFMTIPVVFYLASGQLIEKHESTDYLLSFSKEDCKAAASLFGSSSLTTKEKSSLSQKELQSREPPIFLPKILISFLVLVLLLAQLISSRIYISQFDALFQHYTLYSSLKNTLFDASANTLLYIFLHQVHKDNAFSLNFLNQSHVFDDLLFHMSTISMIQSMLSYGYSSIPSVYSSRYKFNDILFKEKCEASGDIISMYQCLSFDRVLAYFIDSIKSVIISVDTYQIISKEMYIFNELLYSRLALGFKELLVEYEEQFEYEVAYFRRAMWAMFVVIIILILLSFSFETFYNFQLKRELEAFKTIILRIDPLSFVSNSKTSKLLFGKKRFNEKKLISTSHSVYTESKDAIFSLSQDGVIESVNPAASRLFRYTPEQLLGQNINLLIKPEVKHNNQFFHTMQLMKSGQCKLVQHSDFIASRDDNSMMLVNITLIGFSSNDRFADSFALCCRDQTEEEALKNRVEKTGKEAHELLLEFIPAPMLEKLQAEKPEYSFSVPSCTIILIDISQVSLYLELITPPTLLANMRKIYASFDKILKMFPSITKIKVMNDMYLAVGGLFSTDNQSSYYATDCIHFGLKILDTIEELNIQMNMNLQIGIGIHTGGPVVAGVMGQDHQLFDIVGAPLYICQQLQEHCLPGYINISNNTYQLVSNGRFRIDPHEELELSGIGRQMTYTVHPSHIRSSGTVSSMSQSLHNIFLSGAQEASPSLDCLLSDSNSTFGGDILSPIDEFV